MPTHPVPLESPHPDDPGKPHQVPPEMPQPNTADPEIVQPMPSPHPPGPPEPIA